MIETNVKKFWKKINWFRRYSILNCLYVCLVTKWRKIKKSKLNNSPTDWVFEKNFSHLFPSRHVLSKLFIRFAVKIEKQKTREFLEYKALPSCQVWAQTNKKCKSSPYLAAFCMCPGPACCVMTWMIAHFILGIQNDATVNLLHAECMYTNQTTTATNFKAFPWYFQRTKSDRSLTLLLEPTEPMLVAVEAIVWINKNRSQDIGKPRNFHHLLHLKPFYRFNHCQFNQAIICVLFLPFFARNPPVHDIVAIFPWQTTLSRGGAIG